MQTDLIKQALEEDLARVGDITTQAIFTSDQQSTAHIIARQDGVLSGVEVAEAVFKHYDSALSMDMPLCSGTPVKKGDRVLSVSGSTLSILTAERTALNILCHATGIATMTAKYASEIAHTKCQIACTRKTLPNLRAIQKQAVVDGGGWPHRTGLYDAFMIKDNHIAACGGDILKAVEKCASYGETLSPAPKFLEVEVDTLDQLDILLGSPLLSEIDIIMLDNFTPDQVREGVKRIAGRAKVEASGGITFDTLKPYAEAGADIISSGALTHSVRNFDFGLDFE